jgi:hypothetical protein
MSRAKTTENPTAAFQASFGSYKGFSTAVGRPVTVTQAWRNRDNIPPDHHWDVGLAAYKQGLFRTHYAALKWLHDQYGVSYAG